MNERENRPGGPDPSDSSILPELEIVRDRTAGVSERAADKDAVRDFWNEASCGEGTLLDGLSKDDYQRESERRYELEPYILDFGGFSDGAGKRVLEIGVGLGADHQLWAESGADLQGIDLTPRAIQHTQRRFELMDLKSQLRTADAEALPYKDGDFDIVYSWGVLHHSPNTPKAVDEVHRVLAPGGSARIMIYYKYSLIGLMLWLRYAALKGRPFMPLAELYSKYLESPGTKAYSYAGARALFAKFRDVEISTVLTHGDLLTSEAGKRHEGAFLDVARKIWPRWFFRVVVPWAGLFMMITARK